MTYGYWQDTRNKTCFGAPLTTVAALAQHVGMLSLGGSERFSVRACVLNGPCNLTTQPPGDDGMLACLQPLQVRLSVGLGYRPRLRVLLRVPHRGGRMRAGLLPGRAQAGNVHQARQRVQRLAPTRAQAGVRVGPSAARSVLSAAFPVCQACEACTLCGCGHCTRVRSACHKGACACRRHCNTWCRFCCRASQQLWEQRAGAAS